jgi:hypothetical protein
MMTMFDDPAKKLDMVSSPVVTIPAGESRSIDYTFTQSRFLTGAEYFRSGGNFGDMINFQIVHPTLGVLDQFATNIYINKEHGSYQFYSANIPAGLIARAVYFNNGNEEAKFCFNLITHRER